MTFERGKILNALFHDAQEPVLITATDLQVLGVNAAFERVFGYARDFVIGTSGEGLLGDDNSARVVRDNFTATANSTAPTVLGLTFKRSDGAVFNARSTLIAVRDDTGEVAAYATIVHTLPEDVKKSADNGPSAGDLTADSKFCETFYSRTPAMILRIAQDGRIRHASNLWLERFGFSADAVTDHKIADLLADTSRAQSPALLAECWRTGSCEKVPLVFLTRSGLPVEVELSATIDLFDGTSTATAILEDVTDRNRAVRQLEDRNEQLREFAHVAAHDLQAPLRHISVFSKMLEDELDKGDIAEARENVLLIQSSTNRLRGMVQALLEFSLASEEQFSGDPTDLNAVLKNVLGSIETQVRNAGALISAQPLPMLACNAALIERVFSNIVDNALKYVAPGVTPQIDISTERLPGHYTIAFADNGIGISPEFRNRIFQPLKRLHGPDSHFPGFGIGLALCRKIVEAHEGRIWVDTNDRGGSTFFIKLPDASRSSEGEIDQALQEAVGG